MPVYYGEIHDGAVILPANCPLRDGQRVRVEPFEEAPTGATSAGSALPLNESHPARGMWADRAEMADSIAYSRSVRERLARRERNG